MVAETAVLLYEFERKALARLIDETPELTLALAQALAQLNWREASTGNAQLEPPQAVLARLVNLYRGQIESNYGGGELLVVPKPLVALVAGNGA